MFNPINGWTKTKILNHIINNFKGKSLKTGEDGRNQSVCAYRGKEGRKCAAGLFIPDKKYHSSMEEKSIHYVATTFGLKDIMPLTLKGMDGLQSRHDESNEENTLEEMLQWVEANVRGAA